MSNSEVVDTVTAPAAGAGDVGIINGSHETILSEEITIAKKRRNDDDNDEDIDFEDEGRKRKGRSKSRSRSRDKSRSRSRDRDNRRSSGGDRRDSSDPFDRPFPPREDRRNSYGRGGRYRGSWGGNGGVNSGRKYSARGGGRYSSPYGRGGSGNKFGGEGSAGKRLPSNVVERPIQLALAPTVALTKDLMKSLMEYKGKELADNLVQIANVLVESNDLVHYAEDTADLFIKFLLQLSVECSTVATLLAVISKSNRTFPSLVLKKLAKSFENALSVDDVPVSKLCLRVYACLTSCKVMSVDELLSIISPFVEISQKNLDTETGILSSVGLVSVYLVASTLPWCVHLLVEESVGAIFIKKVTSLFSIIIEKYRSPYDMGNKNAIFVENLWPEDEIIGGSARPSGAACWDSLWLAVHTAQQACGDASAKDGLSSEKIRGDGCLIMPWLDLNDQLSENPKIRVVSNNEVTTGTPADGQENPTDQEANQSESVVTYEDAPFFISIGEPITMPSSLGDKTNLNGVKHLSKVKGDDGSMATSKVLASATTTSGWICANFPIYDEENLPDCPEYFALTSQQRFYIAEYIRDILRFFEPYLKEDGTRVGSMEILARHLLNLNVLLPEDSHSEVLIVETLLCMLAQIPAHYPALVHRTLLELCRLSPSAGSKALATGMWGLYNLIPAMDPTSWKQLAAYLTVHLTGYKLQWPHWNWWAQEMSTSAEIYEANKRLFVKTLIDNCTRSVFPTKMMAALSQPLEPFVPNTDIILHCPIFDKSANLTILNKLSAPCSLDVSGSSIISTEGKCLKNVFTTGEDGNLLTSEAVIAALKPLAKEIFTMVENRDDADKIEEWMEYARDVDEMPESEGWRGGCLLQAILLLGGDIVSSTTALLDKYRILLRDLTASIEDQIVMLTAFVEAMGAESHTFSILLDHMLRKGIMFSSSIATWAFSTGLLKSIAKDPWISRFAEIVTDRNIDLVLASFLQKRAIMAQSDMDLDNNVQETPADMSGAQTQVVASKATKSDEAQENAEDENSADDKKDGQGALTASLEVIEEALVASIESCRATYVTAVGSLLSTACTRYKELIDTTPEDEQITFDPELLGIVSLLKHILRIFHGTEDELVKACEHFNEDASKMQITSIDEAKKSIAGASNIPAFISSMIDM